MPPILRFPSNESFPALRKPTTLTFVACRMDEEPKWSSRPKSKARSRSCSRPSPDTSVDTVTSRSAINQENFGFVVRAIGEGGLDFEDDTPETLAEAMAVLEARLADWFEEQGVESE